MIYDTLAGKVPQQDHPMLLMFFLMTQISWYAFLKFFYPFPNVRNVSLSKFVSYMLS